MESDIEKETNPINLILLPSVNIIEETDNYIKVECEDVLNDEENKTGDDFSEVFNTFCETLKLVNGSEENPLDKKEKVNVILSDLKENCSSISGIKKRKKDYTQQKDKLSKKVKKEKTCNLDSEDEPLSNCRKDDKCKSRRKKKHKEKTKKADKKLRKTKKKELKKITKLMKKISSHPKKVYDYKNGKKVLCRSDSESSDFEKYTYFDENKTKKKIKLNSSLSVEDLEEEIKKIKIENICLMKEHQRINKLKLKERLHLREEIRRLKSLVMNLQLEGYLQMQLSVGVGNTDGLVKILSMIVDSMDHASLNEDDKKLLISKLQNIPLTSHDFWKDFNSIEKNSAGISPQPHWVGNLDRITPNPTAYYKPQRGDSVQGDFISADNYPYADFMGNEKHGKGKITKGRSVSDRQIKKLAKKISNCKIEGASEKEEEEEDLITSEEDNFCNADWNRVATKRRNKIRTSSALPLLSLDRDVRAIIEEKTMIDEITNKEDEEIEMDEVIEHHLAEVPDSDDHIADDDLNEETGQSSVNEKTIHRTEDTGEDKDGLCPGCGRGSSWSSFIQRHRQAHHSSTRLEPCHTCNLKFLKSGHFDGRHRLKRPPVKKFRAASFMCDACGQSCTTQSGLTQHKQRHASAQYTCPHCDYACRRRAYMKIHIKTHTSSLKKCKRYFCKMCKFTAVSSHALKRHKVTHTEGNKSKSKKCHLTHS